MKSSTCGELRAIDAALAKAVYTALVSGWRELSRLLKKLARH
jgi:hypothetical protein